MTAIIQQVPLERMRGRKLIPLVALRQGIDDLALRNSFSLISDRDDLDEYKALAVCGSGSLRGEHWDSLFFGLKSYNHDPLGVVDLLLPSEFIDSERAPDIVLGLARQLGAREEDIIWPRKLPPAWQYNAIAKLNSQEENEWDRESRARWAPNKHREGRTLVVGLGIVFCGIIADVDILIVEGEIESNLIQTAELSIARSGYVKGEMQVDNAEIAGVFVGNITVRGTLVIRRTGRVTGAVRCQRIAVEQGGYLAGDIKMLSTHSNGGVAPMRASGLASAVGNHLVVAHA